VAVLQLETQAVSKVHGETATRYLCEYVAGQEMCQLIDRGLTAAILRDQGLEKTGCATVECAVKVGRALKAKYALIGSVTKEAGGYFLLYVKLVDVAKGEITASYMQEYLKEEDMKLAAAEVVRRLTLSF